MIPSSLLDVFVRRWGWGRWCTRVSVRGGSFVFFCFILCGGRKDARGLVVLVDTCQHEEAGDPGKNPPEDAQHYPFHNSWSSFKMFDFEQKLYVS
jgi:hypothetical protein